MHGLLPTPDERYARLTPAQWFTFGFFARGVWLLFIRKPSDLDRGHVGDLAAPGRDADGE